MIFHIAQYAGAIATISAVTAGFIKYLVVAPIKAYIDLKTYPIQPTSNGGKSLPDVLIALKSLSEDIGHIQARLDRIESNTPPF